MAILVQSNKKPSVSFPSQTGSIVTFNSQYAGLPLKSHKIALTATQSGSGTPSPVNERPIIGYNAINIGNSIAYDTNIEQGTLDNSGLNANATNRIRTADYIPVVSGHTYKITLKGSGNYYLGVSGYTTNDYATARTQSTAWLANNTDLLIDAGVKYIRINVRFMTSTDITPADLTGIFVTDITNYFTINLGGTYYFGEYDARSGVLTVTHLGVDMGSLTWEKYTAIQSPYIIFFTTLTGRKANTNILVDNCEFMGNYDAASIAHGGLTHDYSFAGGSVSSNSFSGYVRIDSATAASDVVSALSGHYLVYELETPQTIQLPPCQIDTLQGVNNIWADTGETTVQYIKIGD